MKILVADNLARQGIDRMKSVGDDVLVDPSLEGDSLNATLSTFEPHVLVVRSTRVAVRALDASRDLELIVRAGAGYDTIDVDGASRRGIYVANCPGKNAVAVAELTFGLLLALDRRIPENIAEARANRWDKKRFASAAGLKGRTLGVIGLGNVGQEVVKRAQAFGMNIVAWSRSLTEEKASQYGVTRMEDPLEIARASGAITLHIASTPDTRHLADRAFFEAMKEGAFFINTTRSDVVDEEALEWALDERGIRAGVDVLSSEPAEKEAHYRHPLTTHPSLYITHHIGASTQQAQNATAREAARVIRTLKEQGRVPNCVNLAERVPGTHQLLVRHRDRVGVLARVLDEVRKAGWNVQEMENQVFQGGEAATAHIRFNGEPRNEITERIARNEDVLSVALLS